VYRSYLYIVEDDQTGKRTAQPLLRDARLMIVTQQIKKGKIWRAAIAHGMAARQLQAALWNGDGLEHWQLLYRVENGRIKKHRQTDDAPASPAS
jgi:hypothetical protein